MKELRIIYDAGGLTRADTEIMKWAEQLAENFNQGSRYYECFVANAAMIDAIRLLIARGVLNHEEVSFEYKTDLLHEGEVIRPNRYGRLEPWPRGFCDTSIDIISELLMISIKKRKEENDGIKGQG